MKTPEELTDRFRSEGLKVTPQRQAVFQVLYDNHVHPTAEAVHAEIIKDMPMVSLRTVYQTLNDLTAMGELGHIHVGTGSTRFDPNLEPHHHLVCEACGRVVDVPVDFRHVTVPLGAADGFTVRRTEIVFRGLCAACASQPEALGSSEPPTTNTNTPRSA
jgi:Fe2+ or Zn2+ uptake regulation protein